MELDPFLALDHVPRSPAPAVGPSDAQEGTHFALSSSNDGGGGGIFHDDHDATAATSSSSRVQESTEDPVASLLGTSNRQQATLAAASPAKGATSAKASVGGSGDKSSKTTTPEDLNEELATLLLQKQLPQSSVTALQNLLRENASLREKNQKLKSLLGRSAKAQRDAKNELESTRKAYESSRAEVERLEKRVEVLASRPTHMDLLADFETNFDRALLSIGGGDKSQHQSGGENAAESSSSGGAVVGGMASAGVDDGSSLYDDAVSTLAPATSRRGPGGRSLSSSGIGGGGGDSLLLTELNESKSRVSHLESLNASLQSRHDGLERVHRAALGERESAKNAAANLQLELRMSRMETEHALRSLREKEAVVAEMQLEINLVTQSAVEANRRAAEGMEVVESARRDGEYVDGLEAKVVALQEWALASTESKRLTAERCRGLEGRVSELEGTLKKLTQQGEEAPLSLDEDPTADVALLSGGQRWPGRDGVDPSGGSSLAGGADADSERKLWTKSSSLVVGAGMAGHAVLELSPDVRIEPYETVVLRWKFDLTPADLDIYFSVLKGAHEDRRAQRGADACFRKRHVIGGGGGDVSGAFAVQNACTLVWSNEMSWVRPRTIKWTVDALAIEWTD